MGQHQPAEAHCVHLWRYCTGRQRLPPSRRTGGPPEATRLHGQACFSQNPAHPAASQVTGAPAPAPQQRCLRPPPRMFPDPENWRQMQNSTRRETRGSTQQAPRSKIPVFKTRKGSNPKLCLYTSWLGAPERSLSPQKFHLQNSMRMTFALHCSDYLKFSPDSNDERPSIGLGRNDILLCSAAGQ